MLEDWSREQVLSKDTRTPITLEILSCFQVIWATVCRDEFEVCLFKAVASTAFGGLLEQVIGSKHDLSGITLQSTIYQVLHFHLKMSPYSRITSYILNTLRQIRKKGALVKLQPCYMCDICPVKNLKAFMALKGHNDGCLFRHKSGESLTHYQFWKITSLALTKLGLTQWRFNSHSSRIHVAYTAAVMGYATADIQTMGHWVSNRFKIYVWPLPKC
ncbi:hypothetical protein JRQ81_012538 [Phrynocephalus forsythii]|uniref:Uncharacterized protein n=1 Tax=Phrynocephalus forsythii TaxID=171643 RepID=A0A9Q0Y194_9SAUR|nr:hypothetical protein JRQ81_012538 [Phrynocephalus forsythii]